MKNINIPRHVYEDRIEVVRKVMEERGLSGAVLLDNQDITYFTGFIETVQPFERPVATLIPRRGDPLMFLNEINIYHATKAIARGTCVVNDFRPYSEHPRVDRRLPTLREWSIYLGTLLRERGMTGSIGSDVAASPLLRRAAEEVGATVSSIKQAIDTIRLAKDEAELEVMRAAGRLLDKGQEFFHSLLKPGRLMADVLFESTRFLAVEVARTYPEAHSVPKVSGFSGADSAAPHGLGGNCGALIAKGDTVISLVLLQLNGYNVENERTYIMGEPSPLQARAHVTAIKAQEAGVKEFRVGRTPADIDGATQRVIEEGGFAENIFHRSCHGKGLGSHEYPVDTAFNYTPLPKNAVLSCEPAIYIPDVGGFRASDNFVVDVERAEQLTEYPRDLESLTIRI